jgi:glycosyltransferase involved in cell wall biosynthesis
MEKKLLKQVIQDINPEICILNTPQDLKILKNININKILIQHRTAVQYWKTDSYFNREKELLENVKRDIEKIVTLSEYDKKEFIEKFVLGEKKVFSIRHMSEISELKTKKTKTKKLIIISRITNSKRIDLAIKAMCKLSDYELNIYGDGPDKSILEKLLKNLKLKNVRFCGVTDQVKERLDENSIFIMTSDHEGYPLTTIEAMRRGLPLILRDTFTSAKDIVDGNGILLAKEWDEEKFVNGIEEIYNNYDKYSKKSIEMGKRHSYEVIKKEWKTLLEIL